MWIYKSQNLTEFTESDQKAEAFQQIIVKFKGFVGPGNKADITIHLDLMSLFAIKRCLRQSQKLRKC